MKSVVVTGASTGIGLACVKVLIAGGFQVFGSVRKPADGERLASDLGSRFTPLVFDVTDRLAVQAAVRQVEATLKGETLFGLVNNAGIAVPGPLLDIEIGEFERQIAVNVTGQLAVTKAFAPVLGTDHGRKGAPGRIVMMSSIGGRDAIPFLGPYSASKHALEGLSEALRRELMLFGIDVIIIAPGAVATPIWDKADELDVAQFAGSPYLPALEKLKDFLIADGRQGLLPEVVGKAVKHALTAPSPKIRYSVTSNPLRIWLMRLLPKRFVDKLIARRLGLK